MLRSTPQKYPLSVTIFHGLVAVVMISTLTIGWLLDDADELVTLHKSLGITVLVLVVLRIANRMFHRKSLPASVNPAGSPQYFFEKGVHGLLYLSMLVVPVLGWLKTNAAGHPASFFGLFDLPTLVDKNPDWSHTLGDAHSLAATIFAVLLGVHVLGAVAHLLLHRQNLFKRITP